jgi:hypothetical protein
MARIRLYLENEKSIGVLVGLIRKEIGEWLEVVASSMGADAVQMRETLRKVCDEVDE